MGEIKFEWSPRDWYPRFVKFLKGQIEGNQFIWKEPISGDGKRSERKLGLLLFEDGSIGIEINNGEIGRDGVSYYQSLKIPNDDQLQGLIRTILEKYFQYADSVREDDDGNDL